MCRNQLCFPTGIQSKEPRQFRWVERTHPVTHYALDIVQWPLIARPLCCSLALRPACSPSRYTTLSTKSFGRFVASTTVLVVTGCSDYFPDGTCTRWTSTPFHGAASAITSCVPVPRPLTLSGPIVKQPCSKSIVHRGCATFFLPCFRNLQHNLCAKEKVDGWRTIRQKDSALI